MTDPYTEARNASAGMPGHSMSADVGVREAQAQAMFEAHYGAKLGAWSAETRMYWLGRADNSASREARAIIEAGLKALDTGRNEPLMIWRDQARNWLADEDALNAPTESVKAPEGVTRIYVWWAENGNIRKWSREPFSQGDLVDAVASNPITADDAVAKERERCARIADEHFVPDISGSYQRGGETASKLIAAAIRSLSPDTEGEGM